MKTEMFHASLTAKLAHEVKTVFKRFAAVLASKFRFIEAKEYVGMIL